MSARGEKSVAVLSGGVGGAKLVEGLAASLRPGELSVIGNVGDDAEIHGLWISPDMDILTYTLAGLADKEKGWGFREETFFFLKALKRLKEETWFSLGDRDLATHVFRTNLRREGIRATEIARRIASRLGVSYPILPATDDFLQTRVLTEQGWLNFQEYFVRERCLPEVLEMSYAGAEKADPTPEVLSVLKKAGMIILAPSNPLASIGPILAVKGLREALKNAPALKAAVSPIVGGRSLKGPSDKMLRHFGLEVSPLGVAEYYGDLIDLLVIDETDKGYEEVLKKKGLKVIATDTMMHSMEDKIRLGRTILSSRNEF